MTVQQNLINHVAFVLDASGSMSGLRSQVIKVYNEQVAELARMSQQLDQETRVTVYVFGNTVRCVVYDKDVLRLPSIDRLYYDGGRTALIDATVKSQIELAETAQLYGDHAFLTFVLTDGAENQSVKYNAAHLKNLLAGQGENWTVACLVPNVLCRNTALQYGFPAGNVITWDTSAAGLEQAAKTVAAATNSYMTSRAAGQSGSKTLFSGLTVNNVTATQVQAAGLKPISPDDFMIVPVALASTSTLPIIIPKKSITKTKNPNGVKHVEIMPFIQETGRTYEAGKTYYELVKREKWEPHKKVALIHRQTKQVYVGDECKALLGLTPTSTAIKPQPTVGGEYDAFIQSTSTNRQLPLGSRVLIFK